MKIFDSCIAPSSAIAFSAADHVSKLAKAHFLPSRSLMVCAPYGGRLAKQGDPRRRRLAVPRCRHGPPCHKHQLSTTSGDCSEDGASLSCQPVWPWPPQSTSSSVNCTAAVSRIVQLTTEATADYRRVCASMHGYIIRCIHILHIM